MKKILLILIFVFSLSAFSFPKNWGDKRPLLLAPVKVDGISLTDIWLNPNEQDYIIDRAQTLTLLSAIIKKDALEKIKSKRINKNYFLASDLVELDIYLVFDPNELLLYFKIPFGIRVSNSIDIGLLNQKKPLAIITERPFSGYLNLDYSKEIKNDKFTSDILYYEANVNVKNHILNYGGSYIKNEIGSSKHTREHTRYTYDFKENYSRLVLGDLNYKTVAFQSQISGLGLSVQREFSIVPALVKSSFGLYKITLKRPSIVELFLNESRIYRAEHPSGILNLKNLPLVNGLNDVKIVLTDNLGKREELNYESPYHDTLLPPGIFEYSFNTFIESYFDSNAENSLKYNKDENLTSSFIRYGLSTNKTIGMNVQTYKGNYLLGAEYNTILPRASVSFSTAKSNNPKSDIKAAYAASVSAQTIIKPGLRKPQFLASYQHFDEGFSSIKDVVNGLKSSYNLGLITQISHFTGLGLTYQASNQYSGNDLENATLETNIRFSRSTSLSISAKKALNTRTDDSLFFSFNWYEPVSRVSAVATHDNLNKITQTRVNYLKDYERSKLQLSAGVDKQDEKYTSNVFLNYTNEKASFTFDHFFEGAERRGKLNTRFSFAFTDKSFNLTNYIDSSFIVIDSNTDSPLYVGRSSDALEGLVTKNKSKSITTLSPYRFNTFYINSDQLPFGEDIERLDLTIYPSYKSGSYFTIETNKKRSAFLRLNGRKTPLKYQKGYLYSQSGKKLQYIFTGKRGNVFLDEINPGPYYIILEGHSQKFSFEIPKESGLINLGKIESDEN